MICRTHLVDCLRRKGIQPIATGSVLRGEFESFDPMHALDYDSDNKYHSPNEVSNGGWTLDFKREVTVTSYMIKVEQRCNYMSKWSMQFSNKNESSSFITVHSQDNKFPGNEIYYLPFKCTSRYFRIIGGSPLCPGMENAIAFQYIKFFGYINVFCTKKVGIASFRNNILILLALIK